MGNIFFLSSGGHSLPFRSPVLRAESCQALRCHGSLAWHTGVLLWFVTQSLMFSGSHFWVLPCLGLLALRTSLPELILLHLDFLFISGG